jgi:hypothetical protein
MMGCGNRFANQNLLSTTTEENLAKIVESVELVVNLGRIVDSLGAPC